MFELKPLTHAGIPAALEKASRYRLLNEPEQAESICEDVLRIDPENQDAIATLILAKSDRFYSARPLPPQQVRALLAKLCGDYEKEFFAGIIDEREGIAWLRSGKPHSGAAAYDCLRNAMVHFEKAESLRPTANDDALLRWNSCVRLLRNHPDVKPTEEAAEASVVMGD